MTHESPAQGRASADALNVEEKSTETGGHDAEGLTFKQRTRYSSVTLEGKLAVRGPGYELFDLATTLGKMMAPGGTFRTLLPGEAAIAVVVRPSHRDKVLELAGMTDRAWRTYVSKWEDGCMAHRNCFGAGRGGVTLFFHPQSSCTVPACGATLPAERKQRSGQAEAAFRPSGSSVPRNVLNPGDASRDEQGDALALEVRASVREPSKTFQGISESRARIRRERSLGLGDRDIAALLNQSAAFTLPDGFSCWTGMPFALPWGRPLMPREDAATKARRLLAERRCMIVRVLPTSALAYVRGDSGELREVSWDPRRGWRCSCPAVGFCSHGHAVASVVVVSSIPSPREAAGPLPIAPELIVGGTA